MKTAPRVPSRGASLLSASPTAGWYSGSIEGGNEMRHIVAVVGAVLILGGCGSSKQAAPPVSQPATVAAPTATQTPEVAVQVAGKWYPQKFYDCALKLWNDRVGEWNKLVEKRDSSGAAEVVVSGVTYRTAEEYGKAKGWPATMEATMTAEATKQTCS